MPTTELMRPTRSRSDRKVIDSPDSRCRGEQSGWREAERPGLRPTAQAEANGVAALLASVRPCDGVSAAISRSGSTTFDANASATTWILEAGLKLLEPGERRRIVDSWSVPRRTRSISLVTDGGCDVRIGEAVVTGAVRRALLDWLPLAENDLAVLDSGVFREAPANALAVLLRPPAIWSVDEARTAGRIFPRGSRFEPARFEAIERYALEHVRREHLSRVRAAATKLEMQLPFDQFEVATATIAAGCAEVSRDDECCATIAARQLARYASSAVMRRETPARTKLD